MSLTLQIGLTETRELVVQGTLLLQGECPVARLGLAIWATGASRPLSINELSGAQSVEIPKKAELLGFSANRTGGHLARSMMLPELTTLLAATPVTATSSYFAAAILTDNVLGKPTSASRDKSLRHLIQLYSLDVHRALFRVLRAFALDDPESLQLIAMTCVFCRDEQLRASFGLIDRLQLGEALPRLRMEEFLEAEFPDRFSSAMKKSLAQNVNTTWTEAGHLVGRARKARTFPQPRMLASTYAMFAGYLLGLRGEVLLSSIFGRLVARDVATLTSHLSAAAARGYVRFRHAGGVIDMDFSPLLTASERQTVHGTH